VASGREASGREAVPSATDDPLSAGRLEKYTVPYFMLPLALPFGKCQNQMPNARLPPQIPLTSVNLIWLLVYEARQPLRRAADVKEGDQSG
jgi:hypothetical protein